MGENDSDIVKPFEVLSSEAIMFDQEEPSDFRDFNLSKESVEILLKEKIPLKKEQNYILEK